MTYNNIVIDNALRAQAEELLTKNRLEIGQMSNLDVQNLIQTCQLRLIELTVQNEALNYANSNLQRSRQKYYDFFDHAPVGYVVLDQDGIITKANVKATTLLSDHSETIEHENFSQFINSESQDIYSVHFTNIFKNNGDQRCEIKLANKDEKTVMISSCILEGPDHQCLMTIHSVL